MGDRAQVAIRTNPDAQPVYLYTHWAGYELPKIVTAALKRGRDRWNDATYLGRIVFCEMLGQPESLKETTGYGIGADKAPDLDNPLIELTAPYSGDCKVTIGSRSWTFEQFIALSEDDLDWEELEKAPA